MPNFGVRSRVMDRQHFQKGRLKLVSCFRLLAMQVRRIDISAPRDLTNGKSFLEP